MMNVLMLNPVHPSTPHISAVRAFRFAEELSALGHRVVLATSAKSIDAGRRVPAEHSWERPFVLEVAAPPEPSPRTRNVFSRLGTALRYAVDGGWGYAWAREVVEATNMEVCGFTPDVVWVTFGKMEAVLAARKIAAKQGLPWVLDVKDNWELFVPHGLRRFMAWRSRGFAAVTCNAQFTSALVAKWQKRQATVVYSGVDDAFLQRDLPQISDECLIINLIGGLYFEDSLNILIDGVDEWSKRRRSSAVVQYLGGDEAAFSRAKARMTSATGASLGYVTLDQMAQVCANGHLNAYVGHPGGFHHKLLELACVGRPLLAVPCDDEEARQLTSSLGVALLEAPTIERVVEILDGAFGRGGMLPDSFRAAAQKFRWSVQALRLETVLLQTVEAVRKH